MQFHRITYSFFYYASLVFVTHFKCCRFLCILFIILRKTTMEGTAPIGQGPTKGHLALNLQSNPTLIITFLHILFNWMLWKSKSLRKNRYVQWNFFRNLPLRVFDRYFSAITVSILYIGDDSRVVARRYLREFEPLTLW